MKIKTRLSLQFTLIVAVILLFFSGLVYYFSYASQLNKFRETLSNRSRNTAILLLNLSEVDTSLLKKIHRSTILLDKEEIMVTDAGGNVVYSNNVEYLTRNVLLQNVADRDRRFFSIREKDGVCLRYLSGSARYYVYVMACDNSRVGHLRELRNILLWSILFSIFLSVLASYLFSRKAIVPISSIVRSVKEINSKRLSSRLDEGNRKDEIALLAITFNEMLSDLESAFRNQNEFVSNASHELRTPLSVLISESDYLLARKRNPEEYEAHITGMIRDLKKLNALLNNLLELAQISSDNPFKFNDIRVDEVVFSAISQVKERYQERKVIPKINYPEDGSDLRISGNPGMLEIAFINILDNALKFSHDDVRIDFSIEDSSVTVIVSDTGVGIPGRDLENINKPFTRASNVRYIGGFGIGLSLVSRILSLHGAKLRIESTEKVGTAVSVIFNRVSGYN